MQMTERDIKQDLTGLVVKLQNDAKDLVKKQQELLLLAPWNVWLVM